MSEQRDLNDLQSEMRRVRGELGRDVEELIESTRDVMNWHYYVRHYPWTAMGAAALLGYFLVPKSRRPIVHIERQEIPRPGLGSTLKATVLASAARLAGGLATQYASRLFEQYREEAAPPPQLHEGD